MSPRPSLRARLDRWIFDAFEATPEGLAAFRIAFVLFVAVFVAPAHSAVEDFPRLFGFPDTFFLPPPGPMALFDGFPPVWAGEALHVALSVALAALLVGCRTRTASLATAALLLVGYGFSYSFGKINHNILFVLVPVVMAASGWGTALSVDARRGRAPRAEAWPLAFLALLVGFAFFTAGFTKLIGGWLDPSTHATYGHLVKQFFTRGRQDLLAPAFLSFSNGAFWEALDYATVVFEIALLPAAFHARTFRALLVVAVLFHCSTLLMLNIAFTTNLVVYAAFLPWHAAAVRRATRSLRPEPPPSAWARAALLVATAGAVYAVGAPVVRLDGLLAFTSDLTLRDLAAHVLALGVVAAVVVRHLVRRGRGAASAQPATRSSSAASSRVV